MNCSRIVKNTFTRAQAEEEVKDQFTIIKDATTAYKNAGKPQEKELVDFCNDYLAKTTKSAPGVGCIITIEAGVSDSRENPYTVKDIKNEKGKRTYKMGYQLIDRETNTLLCTCFGTKADAKEQAKNFYRDGYKGNMFVKYVKEVVEGEVGAFEVVYTPSKSTKQGKYILFGFPKEV